MIKLTFCLRRQEHLSRKEFQDYWYNHHGRLAQRLMDRVGMQRYVQTHTSDIDLNQAFADGRGSPPAFDGVAQAWWESEDELRAIIADPKRQAAFAEALEDEMTFIDLAKSPVWLGEEKVVIEDGKPKPY
jgi:uncharacterized protein (TIGR02118 family)